MYRYFKTVRASVFENGMKTHFLRFRAHFLLFFFVFFSCFKSNFLSGTQQRYATVLSYVCKDETSSRVNALLCPYWSVRLGFDRHTCKGHAERKQS